MKLEREKRKTAREARAWELLTDPTVKRLALLSAIIAYSSYVTSKPDAGRTETALAVALPAMGIPMLAAEAGITQWEALLAIGVAAGGAATMASDKAVDAVTLEAPGGYPIVSLLGPFAGLRFAKKQFDSWQNRQG